MKWFSTQAFFKQFPRQIADGQRELIRSHSVKNRHFIGNTSMDAGLSFIMANHAKVKKNDLVFDPFVGTGKKTLESIYAGISADFGVSACKSFLALFQEACW